MKNIFVALAATMLLACGIPASAQQAFLTGLIPQYSGGQVNEMQGSLILNRASIGANGNFNLPVSSVPTHTVKIIPVQGSNYAAYSVTVTVPPSGTSNITATLIANMPLPSPTIFPALAIASSVFQVNGQTYYYPSQQTAGCLSNNGAGTLTWATCGGGGTPGGSAFSVQYNNAGALGGASFDGLSWVSTTGAPTAATSSQVVTTLNTSPSSTLNLALLPTSGASAGTYLLPQQTIDSKGRVTGVSGVVVRPWYFNAFGDSYIQGYGSTITGKAQVALLANDAPSVQPPINYGVGGYYTSQIAMAAFLNWIPHPTYPSVAIIDGGNNDYTFDTCGKVAGTNCVKNWTMEMGAAAAWLSNAPQNRLWASQASQTGTWTTSTTVPVNSFSGGTAGNALSTSTSGATLTFTIPSTNNGHVSLFQATTNSQTGTYTVAVGPTGSPTLQNDAECSGTTTFSSGPCGGTAMPSTVSPQRHEWYNAAWAGQSLQVVVTTTNANAVPIIAVDYLTATPAANLNVVMLQNSSPVFDLSPGIYSAAAAALQTQLAGDGYKVYLADVRAALAALPGNGVSGSNTTTCPATTFTNHPNDCGQIAEAQATETAAQANGVQFWQYGSGGQNVSNSGVFASPLSVASCDTQPSNLTCKNSFNRKGQSTGSVIVSLFDNGSTDVAGIHWGRGSTMPDGTTNQFYMSLFGSSGSANYGCAEPMSAYGTTYLLTGWTPTWCVKFSTGEMVSKSTLTGTQFISTGSTPTIAAAGTTTGLTISGTNMAGTITLVAGGTAASGAMGTITFNGTLTTAPRACILEPNDSATAALGHYAGAPSTTTWTFGVTSAPTLSSTYIWRYTCGG